MAKRVLFVGSDSPQAGRSSMNHLQSAMLGIIAALIMALSAGMAFGQGNTLKFDDQHLRFAGFLVEGKLVPRPIDGAFWPDYSDQGNYSHNWQAGIFGVGLYYQRFGVYLRPIQGQFISKNRNWPSRYLLLQPGVLGISFFPYYSVHYSQREISGAMSGGEANGLVRWGLEFFGEGAFWGKTWLIRDRVGENLPSISKTYPTQLTGGVRLIYWWLALELGYTYQTKPWNEFAALGLSYDPGGFDLSGPYLGLALNVGFIQVHGRPDITPPKPPKPAKPPKPLPPALRLNIAVDGKLAGQDLQAGIEAEATVSVENYGSGPARDVTVTLTSLDRRCLVAPPSHVIDAIPAGQRQAVRFIISSDRSMPEGDVSLIAGAEDPVWKKSRTSDTERVHIVPYQPPELQIVMTIIDDNGVKGSIGNANGQIDHGEKILAKTIVKNFGRGRAYDVWVTLTNQSPAIRNVSRDRVRLDDLAPQDFDTVDFSFETDANPAAPIAAPSLSIKVTESEMKYGAEADLLKTVPLPDPVDTQIPIGALSRPNAVAILIGVSNSADGDLSEVSYAHNDVAVMKKYFVKTFGLDPNNVHTLMNPSKMQMEEFLGYPDGLPGRLAGLIGTGVPELFVYCSGSSGIDSLSVQEYLLPADGRAADISGSGYLMAALCSHLARLGVTHTFLFLETRCSKMFQRDTLSENAGGIVIVQCPLANKGTVIAATSGSEADRAYSDKHHGLFTYFLLKGLRGEADEPPGDMKITVRELKRYLQSRVEGVPFAADSLWHREQLPYVGSDDEGRVVVELRQ